MIAIGMSVGLERPKNNNTGKDLSRENNKFYNIK
jgi:hypothetical protein